MHIVVMVLLLFQTGPPDDDAWIAGYASAILERDFNARGKVDVHQGVLTLSENTLQDKDRDKVVAAFSRIKGVRSVVIASAGAPPPTPATGGGWSLFPEERLFDPPRAWPPWPHLRH